MLISRIRKNINSFIYAQKLSDYVFSTWKKDDTNNFPPHVEPMGVDINSYEYSLFSQNGEDGIIRYIFFRIGLFSKKFLEFGFSPTENNSLRLALKEDFNGLFIDGSAESCHLLNKTAKKYGLKHVKAVRSFLDIENIEQIISSNGTIGEIDIMTIDVDGNDYWFWEKIECVQPRVVVIEYNASLGPNRSVSVPYDPHFERHKKHPSGLYCGASLAALWRLGKRKGYRLIACDSSGVNAFFIRDDIRCEYLPEKVPEEVFMPHMNRLNRGISISDQLEIIKDLPYVEVV